MIICMVYVAVKRLGIFLILEEMFVHSNVEIPTQPCLILQIKPVQPLLPSL